MAKFIVTGGAGFIGSHMTERLLREGHKVVVVDDLSTGQESYVPKHPHVTFLRLDITKWSDLSKNFAYFKNAEGVFHFAACARIQPSIYDPMLTHDTNVTGTLNILEIMRMLGIPNIVYSASSSYYGMKARIPSLEEDPPDCQTPYSVSKYMGELYCSTWAKLHKLNSVRLRYFNVWGPRSPLAGPYAPVVSLFFRQALLERRPMTVVGDGQQRRDFTHVEDVVQANYDAMNHMRSQIMGPPIDEIFNIGTGKNYSILDLANMVKSSLQEIGITSEIIHMPERIGEARLSLAVNNKAERILKWKPKHSIETKLNELRDFYKGE